MGVGFQIDLIHKHSVTVVDADWFSIYRHNIRLEMANIDPETLLKLIAAGFIAMLLLPAIGAIADAKRTAVSDVIDTAMTTDAGWEIKGLLILVALLIVVAIPTWGLLATVVRMRL